MATLASLQDALTDNSRNASLWGLDNNGAGTALEQNGRLELNCGNNYGERGAYVSVDTALDADESSAYVRVAPGGGVNTANRSVYFEIVDANGHGYRFWIEASAASDGFLIFERLSAGTPTQVSYVFYSFTTHRWWRFREASGVVYLETAPDGADATVPGTWTTRANEATTTNPSFAHTAVKVRLVARHYIDNGVVHHLVGFNTTASGAGINLTGTVATAAAAGSVGSLSGGGTPPRWNPLIASLAGLGGGIH